MSSCLVRVAATGSNTQRVFLALLYARGLGVPSVFSVVGGVPVCWNKELVQQMYSNICSAASASDVAPAVGDG